MGINAFYEQETTSSSSSDDECGSCCHCMISCNTSRMSNNTNDLNKTTSIDKCNKTSLNFQQQHFHDKPKTTKFQPNVFKKTSKDLVGNSKEFRIENNKNDLRVIGNGNRIRIMHNFGDIKIIGNGTKVKINKNSGCISYTGNDGRIYLGSESIQQTVTYIGCNGILKVINSHEFEKCTQKKPTTKRDKMLSDDERDNGGNANKNTKTKSTQKKSTDQSKAKAKSTTSLNDEHQWQNFTNNFLNNKNWQKFGNISMPNLKENLKCKMSCKCCKNKQHSENNNKNIVQNIGNIVITNSVNVQI